MVEKIELKSINEIIDFSFLLIKRLAIQMFGNLPCREVMLNTLMDENKNNPVCRTQMIPIGTETAHTELVFHPAYLERMDFLQQLMNTPPVKILWNRSS